MNVSNLCPNIQFSFFAKGNPSRIINNTFFQKRGFLVAYTYPFDDFQKNWDYSPLIIIDTNGFLNLYRYTPETTEHILKVLNSIPKEQFWIPAQVIKEYTENHSRVIRREHSKYKEVTREVERIMLITENDIAKQFIKFNKFKFPLVKELGEKINTAITSIKEEAQKYTEEIKQEVKRNEQMLKEDKVKDFVDELLSTSCIGKTFNLSEMLEIFSEGEKRYKYKIPPGYMDEEKDKTDNTKRKKFGDLLLWKEVLQQAKKCQSPIIFITMDEKEDWWVLDKDGSPVRPRDELINEFKEYSEAPLALMNLTNFVNYISIINNMVDNKTNLEMNALSICNNLIDEEEWEEILNEKSQFRNYLIHSGRIQDYFHNLISDVEIDECDEPEIEIISVAIIENEVIIEGSFKTKIGINITESYSKNYSEDIYAVITASGSISFEFEVNLVNEDDFIDMDTLHIVVGGFDVLDCDLNYHEEDMPNDMLEDRCRDCGDPDTPYHTKNGEAVCESCSSNYETCPDCGKLFEHGTLGGAFCYDCEMMIDKQD